MRGIKIGRKIEGGGRQGMGIFEARREKDAKKAELEAKQAQAEEEKKAKQAMTDESLGIFNWCFHAIKAPTEIEFTIDHVLIDQSYNYKDLIQLH